MSHDKRNINEVFGLSDSLLMAAESIIEEVNLHEIKTTHAHSWTDKELRDGIKELNNMKKNDLPIKTRSFINSKWNEIYREMEKRGIQLNESSISGPTEKDLKKIDDLYQNIKDHMMQIRGQLQYNDLSGVHEYTAIAFLRMTVQNLEKIEKLLIDVRKEQKKVSKK